MQRKISFSVLFYRALLETLMGALQAGNTLLGKLKELGAEGTLDSRPERIRTSVNRGRFLQYER